MLFQSSLDKITHSGLQENQRERLFIYRGERGKKFALIIKSSHFEGMFIDEKGVNCASLDTAYKKIFHITISEDFLDHKFHPV